MQCLPICNVVTLKTPQLLFQWLNIELINQINWAQELCFPRRFILQPSFINNICHMWDKLICEYQLRDVFLTLQHARNMEMVAVVNCDTYVAKTVCKYVNSNAVILNGSGVLWWLRGLLEVWIMYSVFSQCP